LRDCLFEVGRVRGTLKLPASLWDNFEAVSLGRTLNSRFVTVPVEKPVSDCKNRFRAHNQPPHGEETTVSNAFSWKCVTFATLPLRCKLSCIIQVSMRAAQFTISLIYGLRKKHPQIGDPMTNFLFQKQGKLAAPRVCVCVCVVAGEVCVYTIAIAAYSLALSCAT